MACELQMLRDAFDEQATTIASLRSELAARDAEVERLRERLTEYESASSQIVSAWDDDEIGQVDGDLIDGLRYALTPAEAAKEADRG